MKFEERSDLSTNDDSVSIQRVIQLDNFGNDF